MFEAPSEQVIIFHLSISFIITLRILICTAVTTTAANGIVVGVSAGIIVTNFAAIHISILTAAIPTLNVDATANVIFVAIPAVTIVGVHISIMTAPAGAVTFF